MRYFFFAPAFLVDFFFVFFAAIYMAPCCDASSRWWQFLGTPGEECRDHFRVTRFRESSHSHTRAGFPGISMRATRTFD